MKSYMTKVSIVAALVVVLFIILWQYTPFNQYLWTCFVTFFTYFATGAKREDFIGSGISSILGVLWGKVWIIGLVAMMGAGCSYTLTTIVVCGLATFGVCFVHGVLLGKTPVNKIPLAFAGVAVMFAVNGKDVGKIMVCFVAGLIMALAISELSNLWSKKAAEKQNNSSSANI